MDIRCYTPTDYFGSNMYVLSSGNEYAVIDPSISFQAVRSDLAVNMTLKYIILTHAHFDHIFEIDSWVDSNPGSKVIVGVDEAKSLGDSYLNCYRLFMGREAGYYGEYSTVKDGDALKLGDEELCVLDTPGHSSGAVSILTSNGIFVGDTVFADGGVGRCDLPGGDYLKLVDSIRKICKLTPETKVYSGHGRITTIKEIK